MKTNVAHLRTNLAKVLAAVQKGQEVEIQKRNITIARIVPAVSQRVNRTKIGCGKNTIKILGDVTEPGIPLSHWDMLK